MEYSIKRGGHADLERIRPMMEFDFRNGLLMSSGRLRRGLISLSAHLLLLKDEKGVERGYAYVLTRSLYKYVLLKYMSVYPTFRGQGAGSRFLELIKEFYAGKDGMLIEIYDCPGSELSVRQRDRLKKLGWQETDCSYRLLDTESALMHMQINARDRVEPKLNVIMNEFYDSMLPYDAARKYCAVSRP